MKLYRVINKDGKGFYQSYNATPPVEYWYPILFKSCDAMMEKFIHTVHPFIEPSTYDKKFNFAFTSLEDLVSWFPLDILNKMNGSIIEIEIDEEFVIKHPKQCLYNPEKVISINIFDKCRLFNDISFPDNTQYLWKF